MCINSVEIGASRCTQSNINIDGTENNKKTEKKIKIKEVRKHKCVKNWNPSISGNTSLRGRVQVNQLLLHLLSQQSTTVFLLTTETKHVIFAYIANIIFNHHFDNWQILEIVPFENIFLSLSANLITKINFRRKVNFGVT